MAVEAEETKRYYLNRLMVLLILIELDMKTYQRAIIPGCDWQAVTASVTHMTQTCKMEAGEKTCEIQCCKSGKNERIYTVA